MTHNNCSYMLKSFLINHSYRLNSCFKAISENIICHQCLTILISVPGINKDHTSVPNSAKKIQLMFIN